jgi:hypothetical protein
MPTTERVVAPMPLFSVGQLIVTSGAISAINANRSNLHDLMTRYRACDWGDLDAYEKQLSNQSVAEGFLAINASYTMADGTIIWIETDAVRKYTIVYLPEDKF